MAAASLLFLPPHALRAQQGYPRSEPAPFDSTCTFHELSRRPLTVQDSLEMYVPAQALAAGATGELFLAGFPNYLFARQPSGPARLVEESGTLGAVLDSAGNGRTIPAPMDPRRIATVRAVARPDTGWEVVFTELAVPVQPGTRRSAPDSVAGLWSGTFNGHRWTSLRRLDLPARVRLNPLGISAPVLHGNRLAWAVSGYGEQGPVLSIFERVDGTWRTTAWPTGVRIYLSLAYLPTGELVLAGVGGDGSRPLEVNSLFFWAPVSAAAPPRRFADERPIHHPTLEHWHDRLVLTWVAEAETGEEVWATTDALSAGPLQAHLIDPSPRPMHSPIPAAIPGGAFVWVTAHHAPGERVPEIQLRLLQSDGRWRVGRLVSPFRVGLGAAPTSGGNIVLIGADADDAAAMVRSLVVAVQVRCGSASGSGRDGHDSIGGTHG